MSTPYLIWLSVWREEIFRRQWGTGLTESIIYTSLQIAGKLSIGFEPFLPFSSKRLREYLNITEFNWSDLNKAELIKTGTQLNKPDLLFRKVEEAAIQLQTEKLHDTVVRNQENQKSKGGTVIL